MVATSCFASGTPGCAAIACCRAANGTGAGGGAFFATTCRFMIAAGGAVTWPAVAAFAPSTLSRVGATATRAVIGAAASSRAFTVTDALATGCALTNACWGTTITAPCTFRLAYVTLVMVVVL